MNPLIAEIEKRQSSDGRANPLLWRAQELAALKLAVEELQWLRDMYLTNEGKPYGLGKDADATLSAIAEKLGVKE